MSIRFELFQLKAVLLTDCVVPRDHVLATADLLKLATLCLDEELEKLVAA